MDDQEELTEQEKKFIQELIENEGNVQAAAEAAGYHRMYGYRLRDRLAKAIVTATQNYFAVNALMAAHKVVDSMVSDMPNPTRLNAALALLDRVGITKKDLTLDTAVQKATIFILPAKDNEKE